MASIMMHECSHENKKKKLISDVNDISKLTPFHNDLLATGMKCRSSIFITGNIITVETFKKYIKNREISVLKIIVINHIIQAKDLP